MKTSSSHTPTYNLISLHTSIFSEVHLFLTAPFDRIHNSFAVRQHVLWRIRIRAYKTKADADNTVVLSQFWPPVAAALCPREVQGRGRGVIEHSLRTVATTDLDPHPTVLETLASPNTRTQVRDNTNRVLVENSMSNAEEVVGEQAAVIEVAGLNAAPSTVPILCQSHHVLLSRARPNPLPLHRLCHARNPNKYWHLNQQHHRLQPRPKPQIHNSHQLCYTCTNT